MLPLAYNTLYPQSNGTTNLTIYVTRNLNPPHFLDPSYRAPVFEYTTSGTAILNINGTDDDNVSNYFTSELILTEIRDYQTKSLLFRGWNLSKSI